MNELQAIVDAAKPGEPMHAPPAKYMIDAVNAPLRLKSNLILDLTGSAVVALPNDRTVSNVVVISGCENVALLHSTVTGERYEHTGSVDWSVGGWGHGIRIDQGSRNIALVNANVSSCFGDNIYVEDAFNVLIDQAVSRFARRSSMSVVAVKGITVRRSEFSGSGGTPPGCGINFECDTDAQRIEDVTVEGNNRFFDNQGSSIAFGSPGTYRNCRVLAGNTFDLKTQPIYAAGNAAPLGTPWWAMIMNRTLKPVLGDKYRYWGYRTDWFRP